MNGDGPTTSAPNTARLRETAQQQFARDLPMLLRDHLGSWVAYHGEQRIGVASHTGELYSECRQRHLSIEEVVLFEIAAPDEELLLGPMAFD